MTDSKRYPAPRREQRRAYLAWQAESARDAGARKAYLLANKHPEPAMATPAIDAMTDLPNVDYMRHDPPSWHAIRAELRAEDARRWAREWILWPGLAAVLILGGWFALHWVG